MTRPQKDEYNPYYESYINKVTNDNIIEFLDDQLKRSISLFSSLPPEKENYSYAEGKWSIKEVLGHVTDSERIFAYRALCIARGEKQSLPGYEQDDYVIAGNFKERKLNELLNEFKLQREANITLFNSFPGEVLTNRGKANENIITVRAIIYIIAGHTEHHLDIIKTRYLTDN